MHPQAFEYVAEQAEKTGFRYDDFKAVEFGACDVNGNARMCFPFAVFHGVDRRPGNGVDEVCDAGDFMGQGYDLVLSTEMLEHAPDPPKVIKAAKRALKGGGIFLATMAAPERTPHNNDGDHNAFAEGEHYRGITEADLREWLKGWDILDIRHVPEIGDIYVTARKPLNSIPGS